MLRYSLVALPLLAACGSSETVSKAEARHTFDSLNRITTSTILQSLDSVLNGTSSNLKFDKKNFSLSGTLENTEWDGDISVDGSVEQTDKTIGYALNLDFNDIEMDGGAVIGGSLGVDFSGANTIHMDSLTDLSSLKYNAGVDVAGGLDLSGSDRGQADVDYGVDVQLHGLSVSVDGTGNIGGHDIAGWGEVLSLLF